MQFRAFDAEYIQKLTAADPETESHFSAYFGQFIFLKLRARRISPDLVEDVRQETLMRVLKALRHGTGIAQPERFGGFVNTVCHNVLLEFLHKQSRHPLLEENAPEQADESIDLDAPLVNEQRKRAVAKALDELSDRDREILRLVFFEDLDREEICRRMDVDPEYLRVLLHRAKSRFEAVYVRKNRALGMTFALFFCNGMAMRFITLRG
ncbi:MAG TPA: sigma-70 family RNA polymerase sigma factor [Bryobacteraceae bacterium]|nr:sigma-70 family RNA polymerase sigma factor [Bryobacteraceae bacterium]